MADSQTKRDSSVRPTSGGNGVTKPQIVLPDAGAEASDDSPTVISKTSPAPLASRLQTGVTLHETLGTSLRGRTLAHFELIEPIGVGGMAAVIRARDLQLDRYVALKILPPEMAVDQENVRRFHQEARSAARLDHENIARVFFCGEDQNLHFIAFEFVEGENLRAILERRGRLPVAEAVRYLLQIATGLEHAATRGVVHRDIKPSNIIITPTGRAKLVDMGLARSLGPNDDKALTQSGVTLGTFDYISPEQALEPRDADTRSDIYSLGCTFYHMLTGQPPVPEGTAAKKLKHHQESAPIDPRQLNPEISDDVAAIMVRMMAKDPKNRYQRPVHLVQHLMQVAQKVGAGADVPEGVLFVDTPLPSAPRNRPLLMVGLAASLLGGVLFLLSLAPPGDPVLKTKPPAPRKDQAREAPYEKKKLGPVPQSAPTLHVHTRQELEDVFARHEQPHLEVIVDTPALDLTGPPLVFKGKALTIKARDAGPAGSGSMPTIQFKHTPTDDTALQAAIVIESGNVIFSGLRFEIESPTTPEVQVAAVVLRKNGNARFHKCSFLQKGFPQQALIALAGKVIPLASVAVDNPDGGAKDRPRVDFETCYFEAGQDAVAVNGTADIGDVKNCAFGPHAALFHFRGKNRKTESSAYIRGCSAFVVKGPAFRFDDEAQCKLTVEYSIFSCPDGASFDIHHDDAALLYQTDARTRVRYFSKHNCYHNLGLWTWPGDNGVPRFINDLEEFKKEMAKLTGVAEPPQAASVFLAADKNPWAYANPLSESEARLVFEINPNLPELRRDGGIERLGLQVCVWGKMSVLSKIPPATVAQEPPRKLNEKIVDPESDGSTKGVYQSLSQALAHVQPGDVILLKHPKDRREIEVSSAPLLLADKEKSDLTIKPYEGCQPILTMGSTPEPNAALFRLNDGKLQLENLEILLRPAKAFKSQTVVSLFGNGKCVFRNCVFTLKDSERVPLRVVLLESAESAMKMPSKAPRQAPEIRFQDCLVRGDGDLVRVQASCPFELEADNSLIALNGSLVTVRGNAKDTPMEPAANVRLTRVSTFLSEPLLALRASKMGKGLVLTRVEAKDCLFVSLAAKPLVYLEKLDIEESNLREYLTWVAGFHNAYSGFDRYLDQLRPEETTFMPLIRWDEKTWTMFAREEGDLKHIQAQFNLPSPMVRSLSQAVLDDFRPKADAKMDLQNYGATLIPERLPPLVAPRPAETSE